MKKDELVRELEKLFIVRKSITLIKTYTMVKLKLVNAMQFIT